ncbi:MAG: T9SS type A sorting domain-containing protein, partial [Balneolales bacterium]|nr:T9SS type A sorting domain-containing protein [Balneolales bacterium]
TLTKSGVGGTYDSANDGWNLVGNPFASSIDWDEQDGWNRAGLDNTIYVWSDSANSGTGAYLTWNGLAGTLGDGVIAPMQGFWVKADDSATPSISMNDSVRSGGGILRKQAVVPQIRLSLSGNGMGDKAVIMFSEDAWEHKDHYDAYELNSLNSEYVSLSTVAAELAPMDIQALPAGAESVELQVLMDGSDLAGTFTLSWQLEGLEDDRRVELYDSQNQSYMSLKEVDEYVFTMNREQAGSPAATLGKAGPGVRKAKASVGARFYLVVSKVATANESQTDGPSIIELSQNYPNPFNPSTNIEFGIPSQGWVHLEVYDMLGRKVATLVDNEIMAPGYHSVRFDAAGLASGVYIYQLSTQGARLVKRMTVVK